MRISLPRRRFLLAGTGALGSVLLAACAAPAPTATPVPAKPAEKAPAPAPVPTNTPVPAPAPTKPAAEAPKPAAAPAAAKPLQEIKITTRVGGDAEVMQKMVVKFKEKTGITAIHEANPGEPEYWAKIQALHATKQAPDVIWASTGGAFAFFARGVMLELDPLIIGDKYNTEDYVKAALDSLKYNGKLYGMPWGGHPGNGGITYNVDLLNKAGLNVTDDAASFSNVTWMQLVEAGKKATSGDVFGYLPGTDFLSITNFVNSYGGDFFDKDGKKLTINTPEFKGGLQLMYDIFVTHKIAPVPDAKFNAGEAFATGKLAMRHSGYWGQFDPGPKAIADKFKWNVGLTPKGPAGKRGTALTINGQSIWSGTTKREEAWSLVKFLMEPDQNVEIVLAGGGRPALRNSVLNNERLMKENRAHKVFVESIQAAEPWKQPANFRWPEFNTAVGQLFGNLWLGKVTVDQAISEATKPLQDILDKPAA